MTLREYMELLAELGKEFKEKLNGVDSNDAAEIARLEAEFHEQVLGVGREFEPKVRIIPQDGGKPRLEWE
jgi:hypothetical protein